MPRINCPLALAVALSLALSCGPAFAKDAPPIEPGPFRPPDLVELTSLDPTIRLDIRYATANNLVGRPVYAQARAFLQRPAAEALVRANRALKKDGYGLLVFDGYRPWSVTKLFWDMTPEDKRVFVADPSKGSKHNRGCAVDLSLYDLATGREVEMPSAYDEMSERAYPTYVGGSAEARSRRDLLRDAMLREGFFVYPWEWWHFDFKDWTSYPILDVSFSAIPTGGVAKHSATLQQLRAAIGDSRQGAGQATNSPFDLTGYSFDWELTTGGDLTVVVISRNLKGQIAVFAADGQLSASRETGEARSVQLCDLDNDGLAEIITDELREQGTGLLTRYFSLYRASTSSVERVWEGVSFGHAYHDQAGAKPYVSSTVGSLRCDPAGGDRRRPRLIYESASDDGNGKTRREEVSLEFDRGKLVVRTQDSKLAGSPHKSTK